MLSRWFLTNTCRKYLHSVHVTAHMRTLSTKMLTVSPIGGMTGGNGGDRVMPQSRGGQLLNEPVQGGNANAAQVFIR